MAEWPIAPVLKTGGPSRGPWVRILPLPPFLRIVYDQFRKLYSRYCMKIAVTGGAGFIGTKLAEKLASLGHQIVILDHHPLKTTIPNCISIQTDLIHDLPLHELLTCDAIIHLAGANIFCRWTKEYKQLIVESRVNTANAMIDAIKKGGFGPKIFISASAIGYYGDGGEQELTEDFLNGNGFLASVCSDWEVSTSRAEECGMRSVSVRTGVVIGQGGMIKKLLPIFKWGIGGPMGNGRQWFSWIFIEDLINIYINALLDSSYSGALNAVSPVPVRNRDFARMLGEVLHQPAWIPLPRFILKMVLGELANVVLSSQKVIPKKLIEKNYHFVEPSLMHAIQRAII